MSIDLETLRSEGWLSPKEMSEKLSISERSLRRYRHLGYFDRISIGGPLGGAGGNYALYRQIKDLQHNQENNETICDGDDCHNSNEEYDKNIKELLNNGWLPMSLLCEKLSIPKRQLRRYRQNGFFSCKECNGKMLYKQIKSLPRKRPGVNTIEIESYDEIIDDFKLESKKQITENKNYWFDKERNLYVFTLKSKNKPFPLGGDVVSAMLADYSSLAGKSATVEEMSRRHGLSRTTITEVMKALGKTHSSMPYPDEILMTEDEDVLAEDFLRIKEEQIIQKTEKAEWTAIKKDALKWRAFQRNALDDIYEKIEGQSKNYSVPKVNLQFSENKNRRFASVITPTDFHYGKYGWSDESGENYSRDIAEKLLVKRTSEALGLVLEFGVPEKFIVGAGSDWFHIDTWNGTTTNGTPQDTDGCFSQIFIEGCDLAVKYVDILRQVAPVEIVLMAGNHDRQNSLSVLNYLYAWYKNNPEVEVRRSPAPRQYIKYGNSLLGFTHGDKPALKYLPSLMSNEARKHWGECDYRMWFTGDKHHEMTLDLGGTQIYQMPCLSGEDRWHVQNGFTTSRKALSSYLIDVNKGMFASIYAQGGHKS